MKTIKMTAYALVLSLAAAVPLAAQTEVPATGNALRIASGKKGKGYSKLFADIRSVCGAQVMLTEVETEGGLQNLTTLAANQADLGFVQLDTLQDLKGSDEAIGALLAVTVLGSITSGFMYWISMRLMREIPASAATSAAFMIPLFGVTWGGLFLAEPVTASMLPGGLLVLSATALITGFNPFRRAPAKP